MKLKLPYSTVQEKIVTELDEKLNGIKPDLDNIKSLNYLEACIPETLRLEPPILRPERRAVTDCKLGNINISKDKLICVHIDAVRFDPENFMNPNEFKPERFCQKTSTRLRNVRIFLLLT